jgi:hypothetical protein
MVDENLQMLNKFRLMWSDDSACGDHSLSISASQKRSPIIIPALHAHLIVRCLSRLDAYFRHRSTLNYAGIVFGKEALRPSNVVIHVEVFPPSPRVPEPVPGSLDMLEDSSMPEACDKRHRRRQLQPLSTICLQPSYNCRSESG